MLSELTRQSDGTRPGGVIWHTQGSGKSLTMVMLAKAVVREKLPDYKIVLVTDRVDLDDQIYKTFRHCDLEADRAHPDKRQRPFADGRLKPLWGQIGGPLLVGLGCGLAVLTLNRDTVILLLIYVLATAAYTLWLKRVLLVECLVNSPC